MRARSLIGGGLKLVAVALAVVVIVLARRYELEERSIAAAMPLSAAIEFHIPSGTSMGGVARDLAARGLVDSPRFFTWYARSSGKAAQIKAGTYRLEPGMSAVAALDQFVLGREVQYPFTIVEGWSYRDLRAALRNASFLEQTLEGVDGAEVMRILGRPDVHPEGMFFADTYHVSPGTSDRAMLRRALRTLEQRLEAAWAERAPDLPLQSPYEALTLASIIEKETGADEERARIAGVFVTRLRREMLLQTDPTVIYGLGETFDGNLRRRDLRRDTPYNTYTRKGLPPTPIALTGAKALAAALHPEIDGSLFFVAKGDGRHHFSQSLAEHRRAVERYQIRPARAARAKGG